MRGLVDTLLRKAVRAGVRRGLGGDHWAWLVIAGGAYLLQRARRPDDDTVRIDLQPGERYMVSAMAPDRRRARAQERG